MQSVEAESNSSFNILHITQCFKKNLVWVFYVIVFVLIYFQLIAVATERTNVTRKPRVLSPESHTGANAREVSMVTGVSAKVGVMKI